MAITPSYYLSWGVLTIPVKSYPAARDERLELANLHAPCAAAGTGAKLKPQSVCPACQQVAGADTVKGYETSAGQYVLLAQEELKQLQSAGTKTMEIRGFTKAGEIDPVYLGPANYLGPADPAATKAFTLLRGAMADSDVVAVATYVQSGHDKVGMIRAVPEALMLHELFYETEVRRFDQQNRVPVGTPVVEKTEIQLAAELVKAGLMPFDLSGYHDGYLGRLTELIQARLQGMPAPKLEVKAPAGPALDLMAALTESLKAAQAKKKTATPKLTVIKGAKGAKGAKNDKKGQAA